jgi:hypothetical protein
MSNKSASNNAGVSEEVRLADVKKEGVANYLTQLKELPQESEEKKDEKKGAFAMKSAEKKDV